MAHALALELGGGLADTPVFLGQVTKVDVDALGKEGARGDDPVRGVKGAILVVALVKDDCMSSVKLRSSCKLNILKDQIEEEAEVVKSNIASVDVVSSSHGVEVSNGDPDSL